MSQTDPEAQDSSTQSPLQKASVYRAVLTERQVCSPGSPSKPDWVSEAGAKGSLYSPFSLLSFSSIGTSFPHLAVPHLLLSLTEPQLDPK